MRCEARCDNDAAYRSWFSWFAADHGAVSEDAPNRTLGSSSFGGSLSKMSTSRTSSTRVVSTQETHAIPSCPYLIQ